MVFRETEVPIDYVTIKNRYGNENKTSCRSGSEADAGKKAVSQILSEW